MAIWTLITTQGSGGGLTNNHPKAAIYGGTFTFVGTLSGNKVYAVCSLYQPESDSTGAAWQIGNPATVASGYTANANIVPVCQGFSYATNLYPITIGNVNNLYGSDHTVNGTLTNINANATSVQLLAVNHNRKGAYFFNDSDKILYLKLGTTASNTSHTVQIKAGAYYELPDNSPYGHYTGRIDGIWEAGPTGTVRITEVS